MGALNVWGLDFYHRRPQGSVNLPFVQPNSGIILIGYASNQFLTASRKNIIRDAKGVRGTGYFPGPYLSSVTLQLAMRISFMMRTEFAGALRTASSFRVENVP